jgi:hypothetical protein
MNPVFEYLKSAVILIILLLFLNACKSDNSIFSDSITEKDYLFVNEELGLLQLQGLDKSFIELKYKKISKETKAQPVSFYIYAGKILPSRIAEVKTFLEKQKSLVPMPISEKILFRFKIDDKDEFEIDNLYQFLAKEPDYFVNTLEPDDLQINRMKGFYYFQDLTIYRNIQKSRRKSSNCKFVIIDLEHNIVVLYKDQVHYK